MNRYDAAFERRASAGGIALIPFSVAGDPDVATSERIFKTYLDTGADILEIGYPFSDPIADGPVNQRAAMRAIGAGLDYGRFSRLVKAIRRYAEEVPLGVLLYANTIHRLGCHAFCRMAADAGIDSLLVADMPPEEASLLDDARRRCGIASVYIVSELTPPCRMRQICDLVTGFVYVTSRLGPTGTHASLSRHMGATLRRLRDLTVKPLCVGFGITQPEHIRAVAQAGAQGAIVGSALVETIEKNLNDKRRMLLMLRSQIQRYVAAAHAPQSARGKGGSR